MSRTRTIRLKVNGVERVVEVKPNETLLHVLRDKLHVKSVKAACWRGECGLCTVLMNGEPVKSCLVLAVEADGAEILTVEGLAPFGTLAPIQKSFIEHTAFQCGFCTPAFILTAHYILTKNPDATEEEIKEYLNALICRCTGYKQIIDAIKDAAKYY
ncbi:MAG TPA: (2Fe-2S)-binding protein, partial [Acidilobales archaeon]|nr:(2Fe-2S)-binding protein [Acidilobales archaeon]